MLQLPERALYLPFTTTDVKRMDTGKIFDVIIVGGSYAGLSAAMALGRSLRRVLVIDSGLPCNRQTPYSHNFLTQDGKPPAAINALAIQQVQAYATVSFENDLAVSGIKTTLGFAITTASGKTFAARKLIFATGVKDLQPGINGFAACWGITVIHCPYCHGYEFRGKATGILANGERAFHLATLVKNLSPAVTVLTAGANTFTPGQLEALVKNNIPVIEVPVDTIEHDNGHISAVVLKDGQRLHVDALYASLPFAQHCDIPEAIGCALTEQGYIQVDAMCQTTVPGIFACGDNTAMLRSVANAVFSGNLTGAVVNRELATESFLAG